MFGWQNERLLESSQRYSHLFNELVTLLSLNMNEAHVQRQVQLLHEHTLHLFGVIISHLKQSQVEWNVRILHQHTLHL